MAKKINEMPEGWEEYTPLLKIMNPETDEEITEEDEDNLPEPYNSEIGRKFYDAIVSVSASPFNKGGWNDYETTEIYLYMEGDTYYWTFIRKNNFNNNRFGNMRKGIEDFSGVQCKIRPLNPNGLKFGRLAL